MITVERFLSAIKENASRIKEYEKGKDGRDGTCDCVGLIIGALRLAGIDYTGVHGSNYFARYCTIDLEPINKAMLQPGDLAYKVRKPGEAGYDLPETYKNSPDKYDYYHIGVVTSINPLCITHCSTGGMHYDDTIGKWAYFGTCTYVEPEPEFPADPYIAKVTTKDTSLNVRSGPSTDYPVIGKLKKGTEVIVISDAGDWKKITPNTSSDIVGYASSKYLTEIHEDPTPAQAYTRLCREDGVEITLRGRWVIV